MTDLHEIQPGVHYIHKTDHRDGSHSKSQWSISELDERSVFSNTYTQKWYRQAVGWGLYWQNGSVYVLGVGVDRQRQLFFARFVDGNANSQWHGYPADYIRNQQDVPDPNYLRNWRSKNYITNAKMRKILRRQPCNL